ncbi:hypothetical protein ACJMK2_004569 [Sinanodonta woodiana]|uniref:TIR domain-containing protein n=1 Tax=Sinanodonta woodiana TaxID=1069815 RepID=A0ABD3Y1K5_SINWO
MGTSASVPSSKRESDILKGDPKIDQSQKHEINSGPSQSDHSDVEKEHNEVEQVKASRESAFQLYNTALDNIRKIYSGIGNNRNWINDLFENLKCVLEVYENLGQMYSHAYDVALRYRQEAGKTMCETKTTKVIMDIVIDCCHVCFITQDDNDVKNTTKIMDCALSILCSFSNNNPHVSCDIVNEGRFIKMLTEILKSSKLNTEDNITKPLVEMECLPQLVQLAMGKTVEEQREAVGALWVLAFDKDNQAKILENTELQIIELLVKLRDTSLDKEIRKAADSTLWILREQLQNHKKHKHIGTSYKKKNIPNSFENQTNEEQVVKKKKGHVMISYNWGHQKELIKISDILREKGFPVWMDIKNMGGSTLQDMAEAVENASVVLVCFSRKYKDSPNCRAEGEYAFEERKEIIPLKMEADYKRDGWLAMVITGKKFIDFTGKYPFEKKIEELCQRLASRVANEDSELIKIQTKKNTTTTTITKKAYDVIDGGPVIETSRTISYSAPETYVTSMRKWTSTDVDNWINKHSLPSNCSYLQLQFISFQAPECFYNCLIKDLKISFANIDMFIEALDGLQNCL